MLLIRVMSFKGQPIGRDVSARFSEAGGTIGRGEHSTLVLPDPDRYISRTHAIISCLAGAFVVTDNGTKNPITLNGRPMGPGSQARLGHGDQIKLGDYLLEVSVAAAAPAVAAGGFAPTVSGPPKDDPLAGFGNPGSARPSDPFADLLGPASQRVGAEGGNRAPADPLIPAPPREILPADALAALQPREPKIDEMLGLGPAAKPDLLASPSPQGRAFATPELSRPVDPLEALGGIAKPIPPPTIPDHGPELFTPFAPPVATPDPALLPRREPIQPPVLPPIAPVVESRAAQAPVIPPPVRGTEPLMPVPGESVLLRAFLLGAGIPDAQLPKGLTADTMEAIGRLLREAVHGTLDLLRVRGLTKSEMRADVTMIMPADNNPLKFSPSVEAALGQLLAPHGHGFMAPVPAMRDAYDDLRAHQLGFLAGMRAALDEVLARFAPDDLQARLADPSVLDTLLPMNRKAKRWDLFVERYEQVASEAREDFNAAFGKAFRRAYEAQVKQLRAERQRG
jgi:type VI secretion system FHA domain protein